MVAGSVNGPTGTGSGRLEFIFSGREGEGAEFMTADGEYFAARADKEDILIFFTVACREVSVVETAEEIMEGSPGAIGRFSTTWC